MKNVLLLVNKDKNIPDTTICKISERIIECGCNVTLSNHITGIGELDNIDLIAVLGGDGTIIEAARITAGTDIPIFGINYGKIGYLADAEHGEAELLLRVLQGNCKIEKRMMLDITVLRDGVCVTNGLRALNDIVLSNGPIPSLLSFELYCNGRLAQSIRSDGLIVATPTGSTAYSMSAGGPVVDPEMNCIIATPICPHSLHIRPVIFKSSSVLEIKNAKCRDNKVYISVDGSEVIEIIPGDIVRIQKSEIAISLVRVKDQGFLNVLFTKLSDRDN